MTKIFYDLTELFMRSEQGAIYGIERVVAEIGSALIRNNMACRFCIYEPSGNQFYEVFPQQNPSSEFGVDFNVNLPFPSIRLRTRFAETWWLEKTIYQLFHKKVQKQNANRWGKSTFHSEPINLDQATIVTAARPALIIEMLKARTPEGNRPHLIAMLHDFIPLHGYARTSMLRRFHHDNRLVIEEAAGIIANSHFTLADYERLCAKGDLPCAKFADTVQLAHECRESLETPRTELPTEPYLLCVGSKFGHKNLGVVFEAMLELSTRNRPVPLLVLAGQNQKRIRKYLKNKRFDSIRDRIWQAGPQSQTDLIRLYKTASAVVLPSLIEGWGLPAAEALWFGTPVIATDIPVFDEVCGDLALRFAPDDVNTLATHFETVTTDVNACKNIVAKIVKSHSELRTWAQVAEELIAVGLSQTLN